MKKINYVVATLAIALMSVSCVENSEKYKTLKAEKEALQIEANNYYQTLDVLNEMEQGFNAIRESEGKIRVEMNTIEGGTLTKKQQMAEEMKMLQGLLETNRNKIDSLQNVLDQNHKNNRSLRSTIDRMKKELTAKSELIETLQKEMEQKNIHIRELTTSVDQLNTHVDGLTDENTRQQELIKQQDADLNRVWYCIATDKELKEANIVTKSNIFSSKKVLKKEFDKGRFTAVDLREIPAIDLQAKKAKLLSTHPEGSYELTEGADKMMTLTINDPQSFWSLTKYLVVNISK